MSKAKKFDRKTNLGAAILGLQKALDRIEGEYSNIPYCCIDGYISGRTYMNVRNNLSKKQQEKLHKWEYVPCEKCFKKNKVNKLNKNGKSDIGEMLCSLIDILNNRRK
jgi:hypothetical protein